NVPYVSVHACNLLVGSPCRKRDTLERILVRLVLCGGRDGEGRCVALSGAVHPRLSMVATFTRCRALRSSSRLASGGGLAVCDGTLHLAVDLPELLGDRALCVDQRERLR